MTARELVEAYANETPFEHAAASITTEQVAPRAFDALRAVLKQHDADEHDPRYCQRCTDCVGDRMLHPCDTQRAIQTAMEGS